MAYKGWRVQFFENYAVQRYKGYIKEIIHLLYSIPSVITFHRMEYAAAVWSSQLEQISSLTHYWCSLAPARSATECLCTPAPGTSILMHAISSGAIMAAIVSSGPRQPWISTTQINMATIINRDKSFPCLGWAIFCLLGSWLTEGEGGSIKTNNSNLKGNFCLWLLTMTTADMCNYWHSNF